MATDNLDTSALTELLSSEPQRLLDEIDGLRLQGISDFVFLPYLRLSYVVKAVLAVLAVPAVLDAISGVPLPRMHLIGMHTSPGQLLSHRKVLHREEKRSLYRQAAIWGTSSPGSRM
jgi:hypothetical protein